jgi:hypothetical protein
MSQATESLFAENHEHFFNSIDPDRPCRERSFDHLIDTQQQGRGVILMAEGLGNLGLMASSIIGLISEAVVAADRAGYPLNRTALATVRAELPIGSTGSDHAIGRHVTFPDLTVDGL